MVNLINSIINIKKTNYFDIMIDGTSYPIDIYYLINKDNYISDYDLYINKLYGDNIKTNYLLHTKDNITIIDWFVKSIYSK